MKAKDHYEEDYRDHLSLAIIKHREVIYTALTSHNRTCLCCSLATFMLAEAGWSKSDFIAFCEAAGVLDEA